MLYNVLPPLIFFASLGGTILVVSRVILRIRRDQVATELQSHVAKVSKGRLNKVQDLAGILAPNHISVHNFKNRISFMAHTVKDTSVKVVQDTKNWHKQRTEKKKQAKIKKKTEKLAVKTKPERIVNSHTDSIKPPTSRIREPIKKIITRAKKTGTKSQGVFKKYVAEVTDNIKNRQTKQRTETKYVEAEDKKPKMEDVESTTNNNAETPVISLLSPTESDLQQKQQKPEVKQKTETTSNKTTSISKFFNKKEDKNKDVLELAKEALEDAQTQKVEDILIPYIVKHPTNTSAYMMLGKAAICRKNWTEATEIFEQVTRIKPETKGCYAALGQVAFESGNLTKAIEALQKAHDQNPQDTRIIKRLIKIATRMDNQPMQRSLTEELELLEQNKITETGQES